MEHRDYFNPSQPRDNRGRFVRGDGSFSPGSGGPSGRGRGRGRRRPPVNAPPREQAGAHDESAGAARDAGQDSTARAHGLLAWAFGQADSGDHAEALGGALRAARAVRQAVADHGGHPLVAHAIGGLAGLHRYLRGQNLAGTARRARHALGVAVVKAHAAYRASRTATPAPAPAPSPAPAST